MDAAALPYWLLTMNCLVLVCAALVVLRSTRALRSTRTPKPDTSSPPTPSETLHSAAELEKLQKVLSRVENRLRMRQVRGQDADDELQAPPKGAPKAALYRHYGFRQAGPAFAQHQLDLERDRKKDN